MSLRQPPCANTRAWTAVAPAARSGAAQARSVAPVVATSSTSSTVRPATGARQAKAPATFAARSALPAVDTWGGVGRTRAIARGWTSTAQCRPIARASSAAWLKPRSRSRRGCNGTGTIRSAAIPSGQPGTAGAINAPIGAASADRRSYFSRCTSRRAGAACAAGQDEVGARPAPPARRRRQPRPAGGTEERAEGGAHATAPGEDHVGQQSGARAQRLTEPDMSVAGHGRKHPYASALVLTEP